MELSDKIDETEKSDSRKEMLDFAIKEQERMRNKLKAHAQKCVYAFEGTPMYRTAKTIEKVTNKIVDFDSIISILINMPRMYFLLKSQERQLKAYIPVLEKNHEIYKRFVELKRFEEEQRAEEYAIDYQI